MSASPHLAPPKATDPAEDLFRRWRESGDGRALAALFDRTAPDLFRIALSVAPDAATAEEAVQETFLAVIEDPARCDPSQPVMPWLVGVLRHKVVDARRRARRVPDPLRVEPRILPEDPASGAERRDAIDRVRAAIDRLPEPYRAVALLRWEYGLEPGEIAHARGEPPGTVRSLLSRALQRLRVDLGGVAVLALVLGVRPAEGLAAMRQRVLEHAGVPAAAAAGLVVGGIAVGNFAAAAILLATLALGALVGGSAAVIGTDRSRDAEVETARNAGREAPPSPDARGRRTSSRGRDAGDETSPHEIPVPRRRAAPPSQPAAEPAPGVPTKTAVLTALGTLDGTWATAWKVGQDLARLPDQPAVLAALREAWPRLGVGEDRQNLMKGFDFDGHSPVRLDVFDLGARDPDLKVRWYALNYFEPYAGRRLVDAPDAWRAWRETSAGKSPDALLDASAERLLAALRDAPAAERADLVALLGDVAARRESALPSRDQVLAAAVAWYADPAWMQNPRPIARLLAAARLPEHDVRALFGTLLTKGTEGERRALVLAGVLEAHWAWDQIALRLRAESPALAGAAARALSDLGDLRAVPLLIEAFDTHPEGKAASAIVSALENLTGVSEWNGKDAAWWREWWKRNGGDVTASPSGEERR
jgi:RNA polymerase sigma-70 factor (ECF subfamily)